ncbi:MAG TPA: ribosome maturation factor [Acidimicrobiaceae bacterium]|nr:ribosome maturation factor [Acidimicrobiaceae bacterium]
MSTTLKNTVDDTVADAVSRLIESVVDDAGFDLYDVQHRGDTLAVLLSGRPAPDAADLSRVSRAVSRLLDEHDPMPGRYVLEVSSPGLERRLTRPDHFAGAVGEIVSVKLVRPRPAGEPGRVEGRLLAADADGITIDAGTPAGTPRPAQPPKPRSHRCATS